MKKLVNGKVIEIANMKLFELAAEGLALQNTAVSNTSEGIEASINSPLVHKYIKQYDIFFKSMPYPLYAIEADIKYATLGSFIKTLAKEKIDLWVHNGLNIKLDAKTGMTLNVVNNTWSIIYDTSKHEDNTTLELYTDAVGYKEYAWILKKIVSKENTANFYAEFMPDFVKACNGQAMVLKWELENILTFGSIPQKMQFKHDKIINPQANEEYTLDIFFNGTVETDEKVQTWSFVGNGVGSGTRYKTIKTYGFDVYAKVLDDNDGPTTKMEPKKINGMHNLFMELCGLKNAKEMNTFPEFEGIIFDTNLVFTIDRRLFVAKSNRLVKPVDVAHGVELYAVDKGKVYFVKSKKINERISKDSLYSYNIADGTVRLCKIIFSY